VEPDGEDTDALPMTYPPISASSTDTAKIAPRRATGSIQEPRTPDQAYPLTASANGSTIGAPASRNARAASARVHPLST
jgi:hypothetical protein